MPSGALSTSTPAWCPNVSGANNDVMVDENYFISALNVGCNIEDFDMRTIEAYLWNHIKLDTWKSKATDATP